MAFVTVNESVDGVTQRNVISGGWLAILKETGVDVRDFPQVMDGSDTAVIEHDGHLWTLKPWQGGGGFASASRPLTAEEQQRSDDEVDSRTYVDFFGLDRLRLCRKISLEMMRVAGNLKPDNPPTRAKRRDLRKRLDALAVIQFDLMQLRGANVNEARDSLKEMGVVASIS